MMTVFFSCLCILDSILSIQENFILCQTCLIHKNNKHTCHLHNLFCIFVRMWLILFLIVMKEPFWQWWWFKKVSFWTAKLLLLWWSLHLFLIIYTKKLFLFLSYKYKIYKFIIIYLKSFLPRKKKVIYNLYSSKKIHTIK